MAYPPLTSLLGHATASLTHFRKNLATFSIKTSPPRPWLSGDPILQKSFLERVHVCQAVRPLAAALLVSFLATCSATCLFWLWQ